MVADIQKSFLFAALTCLIFVASQRSERECEKYAAAVFQLQTVRSALLSTPFNVNASTCAQTSRELISGGKLAREKEFPHMAVLGYGDDDQYIEWKCGGSLISHRFILTAAHCLDRRIPNWALLGDLNYLRTDDVSESMLLNIVKTFRHPESKPPARYNDIALLKLEKNIVFNPSVRPACLHTVSTTTLGQSVTATGWGLTVNTNVDGSPDLMKVGLKIGNPSICRKTYKVELKLGYNESTMICAKGSKTKLGVWKDTCQGDSGGPLQIVLKNPFCMYSIAGLTSFGSPCGEGASAVYTRVSFYVPWIESIVWPN